MESPLKNILVIGGGGFIGSHLIESLLKTDVEKIVVVDLDFKKCVWIKHDKIETHLIDYYKWDDLNTQIQKADVVISLAAICNPIEYMHNSIEVIESNYDHPNRIVELCAKSLTWLIHFSTSEVFGQQAKDQEFLNIDSPYILGGLKETRWVYAAAKQLMERKIYAYAQQKLPWTIIRPFNFIGPKMDYFPGKDGEGVPRVLANFAKELFEEKPLSLVNGGLNQRVFTDIRDAVDAILLILQNPLLSQGQVYHVGNAEQEFTIAELAEKMILRSKKMGHLTFGTRFVEAQEFYGHGYADSNKRVPDMSALKQLGWKPQYKLDDTLKYYLEWFFSFYAHRVEV